MGWVARLGVGEGDAGLFALGALLMALTLAASTRVGDVLSLTLLVALAVFGIVVLTFVARPHVAIALTIPLFALLPAIKILAVPWIGPLKDVVALAAITAALVTIVQETRGGGRVRGDVWTVALFAFLFGLYMLNMGGGLERTWGWAHGIRLFTEPLLLLLVGMTLRNPRRTLDWALGSLVATSCFVAFVGIVQQLLGGARLVELGYLWNAHVRTINGFLRSFGTLEEPFAYAALLVFGFCAVCMWMRPGRLALAAGVLIALGLGLSVVRSSALIALGVLALLLARHGRTVTAVFLLALVVATTLTFVMSEEATERRVVQGGPSLFLTLNGRTKAWKVVLGDAEQVPLGRGVGEVGTAADRATFKVTRTRQEAEQGSKSIVVDSGYFATVADVGLVGLAALLLLLGRLGLLAKRAIERGSRAGWVALAVVMSLSLDAVTRESFTAFPTAYVGLLLAGLAIAAAQEEGALVTERRPLPFPARGGRDEASAVASRRPAVRPRPGASGA